MKNTSSIDLYDFKRRTFFESCYFTFCAKRRKESTSKPIVCKKEQTLLFWRKMNERVLKTIKKSEIPYFISDERDQVGVTFGERLSNSITKIINLGFDKVIIVGNDCAELKSNHLIEAVIQLKKTILLLVVTLKEELI